VRNLKQSTADTVMVLMISASDHTTGAAGLTLAITASKAGGPFASITPTVTDRGNGWYAVALTTIHTDTIGDFALHVTASGADPADTLSRVVAGSLDADVSSRSTYAGGDTTGTTTLLGRVTGSVALASQLNPSLTGGIVVVGSTASSVTVSGLPAGKSYLGQRLQQVASGEARLIAVQSYAGGNYTFGFTGVATSIDATPGPFSAVTTGETVFPIP